MPRRCPGNIAQVAALAYHLCDIRYDPVTPGALAGYNFQFDKLVFGPEIDGGWIGRRGGRPAPDGSPRYDEIGVSWTGHARGRVGYAFGGILPYVSVGLAGAGFSASHFRADPNGNMLWEAHDTRVGYSLGGGIDVAEILAGWVVRGEYLYDHFASKRYDWVPGMRYSVLDLTIHTARLALTHRFTFAP